MEYLLDSLLFFQEEEDIEKMQFNNPHITIVRGKILIINDLLEIINSAISVINHFVQKNKDF